MSEELVPAQRTVMSAPDVFTALKLAWLTILGTAPTRAALLTLLSQWSLETGGGFASKNWNLAGIKHVPGDGHNYATYLTEEVIGGVRRTMTQNFRAYGSLDEGAIDYLQTLRRDFGFAWPAVEAGDVTDFAHRLKVRGYYTAPESEYAAGLRARYALLDRDIPPDTMADSPQAIASIHPIFVPPELEPPEVDPGDDAA